MQPEPWTLVELLQFLLLGFAATVTVEIPFLFFGLSARHSAADKIVVGLLLTAFSYPIVILVIPGLLTIARIQSRLAYIIIAESYAAIVEIAFLRYLVRTRIAARPDRDAVAVLFANLCSFGIGELFLTGKISQLIHATH
ncbi:MAG: hypothetical protein R3C59_10260 [Planctomycetaceae bacterium]